MRNIVSVLVPHGNTGPYELDGWQPFISNLSWCVNTFRGRKYVYVEIATCNGVVRWGDSGFVYWATQRWTVMSSTSSEPQQTCFRGFPLLFTRYSCTHLDPLMWSCGFWEHIDWSICEKGRISNRFLKTRGYNHPSPWAASNADIKKKATLWIDLGDHIMDFASARLTAVMGFYAGCLSEVCQLHRLSMECSIHLPEAPYTYSWGTIY